MRRAIYLFLTAFAVPLWWTACGGSVSQEPGEWEPEPEPDASPTSQPDAKKDAPKDAVSDKKDGYVGKDQNTKDVLPDYYDPGCPDAPPPIIDKQCDPLGPVPGVCAEGEACYPYVVYPSGPCEAEVYGALCMPAGYGQQSDPCEGEPCAPSHVCVITGAGTQCVHLCSLTQPGSCPDGLVCEPIDVLGYGGCL